MALDKAGIIRLGVALGVDYALTHSCYDPARRRRARAAAATPAGCAGEGFRGRGIADPTRYADDA